MFDGIHTGALYDWSEDQKSQLRQMRLRGDSFHKIANALNFCSAEACRRKWRFEIATKDELEVERRSSQGLMKFAENRRRAKPHVLLFTDCPEAQALDFGRLPARPATYMYQESGIAAFLDRDKPNE